MSCPIVSDALPNNKTQQMCNPPSLMQTRRGENRYHSLSEAYGSYVPITRATPSTITSPSLVQTESFDKQYFTAAAQEAPGILNSISNAFQNIRSAGSTTTH
jgi:hypothetical protein